MKHTSSALISGTREKSKGFGAIHYSISTAPAILIGILIGILLVSPYNRQTTSLSGAADSTSLGVDRLSTDEIQTFIKKALSRLEEQQGAAVSGESGSGNRPDQRTAYNWKDSKTGVKNVRRLLASAKLLTIDALHQAAAELTPSDWPRVIHLINGVCKVIPTEDLRGMAAVRDDRPSEVLVDPEYAAYLSLDDEAVFVLAHELTHVAARSGKLDRLIESVSETVSVAHVRPTQDQKEDLACDFVGELVLKRFIARHPTHESVETRISRVFGYESPDERFARAWEDFCASYNGDPGDKDHLAQYQTIRALLALDPQLQSIMPMPGNSSSSSPGDCR